MTAAPQACEYLATIHGGLPITIGIDPGLDGAIAILEARAVVHIYDMPTMAAGTTAAASKKRKVNPAALAEILLAQATGRCRVAVERVQPMPSTGPNRRGMGAASAFNFGQAFALAWGIPMALGFRVELIQSTTWKRWAKIAPGADKDAARLVAIERHPEAATELQRKKDQGRADAILIAEHLFDTTTERAHP